MTNFLEIVNGAVYESKQSLDPLTSANFGNPPRTSLYDRMKRWANASYLELINDKPEWFFTSQRAVITIEPRVHLSGFDPVAVFPSAGDVLLGELSGVEMVVIATYPSTEPGDAALELTVGVEYIDSGPTQLILNEPLSITYTQNASTTEAACRVGGRGRYDLNELIPTLDLLMEGTVTLQPAVDYTDNPSAGSLAPAVPINIIPWERAVSAYRFNGGVGQPYGVVQMPDGNYDFLPRPDKRYDMAFTYSQKGVKMETYDDEPDLLPEKYREYLVWKTILELADFNKDQMLYARAKKKADMYLNWMARDFLPDPVMDLYRFDSHWTQYNG